MIKASVFERKAVIYLERGKHFDFTNTCNLMNFHINKEWFIALYQQVTKITPLLIFVFVFHSSLF